MELLATMIDRLRWNISRNAKRFIAADAIVISIPKSGRTWIRTFLYKYYSFVTGENFSFDIRSFPTMPKVYFTHDRWQHLLIPGVYNRVRGRNLVPRKAANKNIILLARDPRDVVVSLYFHFTKRQHVFDYPKSLAFHDMLRHNQFGLPLIIRIMNSWAREWKNNGNCHLLKYEDLMESNEREFQKFLHYLGITKIDQKSFNDAIEFSSFENMHQMESTGSFSQAELSAPDRNDKDSYKVRKGKVGGYLEYMNSEDIEYSNQQMKNLDPYYNYDI